MTPRAKGRAGVKIHKVNRVIPQCRKKWDVEGAAATVAEKMRRKCNSREQSKKPRVKSS